MVIGCGWQRGWWWWCDGGERGLAAVDVAGMANTAEGMADVVDMTWQAQ